MLAQRLRVPLLVALLFIPRLAPAAEDGGADPDPKAGIRVGGGGLADGGCECRSSGPHDGGAIGAVGLALALTMTLCARRRRVD